MIILNVEGMMCMHCVAHVKEGLEKIEGVESVEVSLEDKTAKITTNKKIEPEIFINTIKELGYSAKLE